MAITATQNQIREALNKCRNLTLEERKALTYRDTWHDYTMATWRSNGKVRIWKTRPDQVSIPAKFGLYNYGTFREDDLMIVGDADAIAYLRRCVLDGIPGMRETIRAHFA